MGLNDSIDVGMSTPNTRMFGCRDFDLLIYAVAERNPVVAAQKQMGGLLWLRATYTHEQAIRLFFDLNDAATYSRTKWLCIAKQLWLEGYKLPPYHDPNP